MPTHPLRRTARWLWLCLALTACGGAASEAAEPDDVSDPPAQEEPVAGAAAQESPPAGPATPRALLEAIRDRVASGEIDRVRELVFDYEGPDHRPVADVVVQAIREGDDRGDFAFSLPALEVAIARADEFGPPSERLALMLGQSFGDLDARLADPSHFMVFEDPRSMAHVVLVELDGVVRLVFWENLTSLAPGDAPPPPAAVAEEEAAD